MNEENESTPDIVKKSRKGFISLSLRSSVIYSFQIASTLSLAHFLNPRDYGIFGILNGWIGALNLYTDIGLGEALVQKKEDLLPKEISVYFGMRLLLSTLMALIIFFLGPWIISHYKMDAPFIEYTRFIGLLMVLDVLSSPSKLILARKLDFTMIGKIDTASSFALYLTQISLAYLGFGFWSFFIAILVRSLSSYIGYQMLCPFWRLPSFDLKYLSRYYRFGIFSQLNSIIPATTSGLVIPYILNLFLSVDEIGYLFWVNGLVGAPIMFVFNYVHVFLASLSRLQDKSEELKFVASRSIENMILGLGLIFGIGAVCSEGLVYFLFNPKWYPAIPLFSFASIAVFLYGVRLLGSSVASASGKPELRTKTEVAASIGEIGGHIFFCSFMGVGGYFLSKSVVFFPALLLMFFFIRSYIRKEVYTRFFKVIAATLLSYLVVENLNLAAQFYYSIPVFCFVYLSYLGISDKEARSDFKKFAKKIFG